MMFGLTRLYGAVYIQEKGAFVVSIWSWVGELTYIIAGVFYGHFVLSETLTILVLASMMLVWSLLYYRQAFQPTEKK